MQRRPAVHDGIIKFIDDFAARHSGRRQRIEALLSIAVDGNAARGRPQVSALARHDDRAELLVQPAAVSRNGDTGRKGAGALEGCFFISPATAAHEQKPKPRREPNV